MMVEEIGGGSLAIIGDDPSLVDFLRAARQERPNLSVHVAGQIRDSDGLHDRALFHASPEKLLEKILPDIAFIGRGQPEGRAVAWIHILLQGGTHVFAAHPLFDTPEPFYELDAARESSAGTLMPWIDPRRLAMARRLLTHVETQEANGNSLAQFDWESWDGLPVEDAFAHYLATDLLTMVRVAGNITKVSALGGGSKGQPTSSVGIQFMTQRGIPLRWSFAQRAEPFLVQGELAFQQGHLRFTLPSDSAECRLELAFGHDPATVETISPNVMEETARAQFLQGLGESHGQLAAFSWSEALASAEIVYASFRSLRTGKAVEPHLEPASEEQNFKSVMASVGCLFLMAIPFLLLGIAVVGELAQELRWKWLAGIAQFWPWLFLGLLLAFLLLQGMRWLVPSPQADTRESQTD